MPATVLRLLSAAAPESTDAELLGQFVAQRDDAAFTELVRRHGPIVWRVCRRLVGSTSADDAFQATFLILACQAESVRKAASVGSWLIGVAGRVARQIRKHDRRFVPELPDREAAATSPEHLELAAILDDELTQLPEHLRDPVVLCFLQGQTQQQAAAELGGSVRTIRRRLDRAKALLRLRLERRGVVSAVIAGLIAGAEAPVLGVPPAVVQRTVQGTFKFLSGGVPTPASILAKGIVMGSIMKFKMAAALVVSAAVALIGLAGGLAQEANLANATQPLTPPAVKQADAKQLIPPPRLVSDRRAPNFLVRTGDDVADRAIANEAEFLRREIARQWLGRELPDWEKPCKVRMNWGANPEGGSCTFEFGTKKASMIVLPDQDILLTARMDLGGSLANVLYYHLPREVAHVVMATYFGVQPPRWIDTGISRLSEASFEQARLDDRCRTILSEGRGIRLRALIRMTEYPRDSSVMIAQSHSIVRFLLTRQALFEGPGVHFVDEEKTLRGGLSLAKDPFGEALKFNPRNRRTSLMAFAWFGAYNNRPEAWNNGARQIYGFESVDELEAAWLDWMKKPESKKFGELIPEPPPANDKKPELIPPTKLPGQ